MIELNIRGGGMLVRSIFYSKRCKLIVKNIDLKYFKHFFNITFAHIYVFR